MMIMWSKYDGSDDASGEGVTQYMEAESVWKPTENGNRERVRRIPPPEVLKGDAALMRQAIRATPFQCRYSSAVLSFERGDIDVAAFNAGAAEPRRQVAEAIRAFEDSAYAGIAEEHRPPTFWTTHTHTGRLELNVVAPRAILAGNGKLRSINPHPPGAESRKLFDSCRDMLNARYGWADPEDPKRARLVSVPNYVLKIAAEAKRAGKESKKHLAEQIGEWAEASLAAGEIKCRDDLLRQLQQNGIQVARTGKDYVTLVNDQGARMRLRGRIFSAAFTSPEVLPNDAEAPPRLDLQECEERLAQHQSRRAQFHQQRYGGPDWAPPDSPGPTTPPQAVTLLPQAPVEASPKSLCEPSPRRRPDHHGDAVVEPARAEERQRFKARLFVVIFGATLPDDLLLHLRWVDRASRTVRLTDGAVIVDHGERITASKSTGLAVKLMLAEAQAKGWSSVKISGSAEFQRLAIAEAARLGLSISNSPAAENAKMKEDKDERADATGTPVDADHRPHADRSRRARTEADAADQQLDLAAERIGRQSAEADDRLRQIGKAARPGVTRIRANRRQDIERLKTEIDLCAVAATLGFVEDAKAGDRNHTIMRHPDGSKLIIGVSQSGHWVFSSNIGDRKGTVIDLVQWRTGASVTEALARLRQWHRTPETKPWDTSAYSPRPKPRPIKGNGLQAIQEWESANRTSRSVFLEKSRGISPETLASPRFADTFRVDDRQNAVFPYRTKDGLVGTERRNRPSPGSDRSFKAYTAGAVPGIWTSNASTADTRLVIVESPIDAMSHQELSPPEERATTRYVAIRNGCADDDLEAVIRSMPVGAVVVAACDRDPAGDGYTAKIRALAEGMGRDFSDERPQAGDWNDILRGRTVHVHTQPPSLRR